MVNNFIPFTKAEALNILSKNDCYILAGGSDLMVAKKNTAGLLPKFDKDIIYLSHIDELKGIYEDGEGIHVKAMTPLCEVEKNTIVPSLVRKTISQVASTNIRHFATLVGNLANASPAGDTIVTDVTLDAKVKLESVDGVRFVDVFDFVKGVRKIDRNPNELITEIIFPKPNHDGEMWFKVGSRKADSISKVMVAGIYKITGKTLTKFALTIGSVSIKPVRSYELEKEIEGCTLDQLKAYKEKIVEEYGKIISPIDDQRSTKEYRLLVAKNIVRKFINQIIEGGSK